MSLKNVLIIVDNIDESINFYEELFGLRVITRLEGNVIMSEGLVLQDVDVWYDSTKIHTTPHNNMTELYFEDNDIEGIIEKLESGKYVVSYVTVRRHIVGGTYRTLISVQNPLRLCRTGICRSLSAG